ncbi:LexA family protein [Ramlibacter sp.]|uniref:LexA family protein n=1 Tax=Ramlibacter sp. TaxID=1917967 RepID=UPI003D133263
MASDKKNAAGSGRWNDPLWDEISKMTEEELRQELIDEGIDPDHEIAAMRRLGRVMAARFADQIEREARMLPEVIKPLPLFAEAVAAGHPAWADGNGPRRQASLLDVLGGATPEDTIWARVSGWSMRDEGINDGDLILVNVKTRAKDGDIVLAHLAGQGQVVKRLRIEGGKASLMSAHPDYAPIPVDDPATLTIHGVVVGRAGTL